MVFHMFLKRIHYRLEKVFALKYLDLFDFCFSILFLITFTKSYFLFFFYSFLTNVYLLTF